MSRDQEFIDKLVAHLKTSRGEAPAPRHNGHAVAAAPTALTDQDVLKTLFSEKAKGHQWESVYRGAYEPYYPSPSEAVAALLWKLAFYTQKDPAQMERLIRGSALAGPKFDERRSATTWVAQEIGKAIDKTTEVYRPKGERHRHRHSNNGSDGDARGSEAGGARLASISFAGLPEPAPPEEVWEGVIVRGWPALWFGGTGVTKSVTALAVAQAIADENTKVFLGRDVITAGVMYADWELNETVQGRRAYQIARGRGRLAPPPNLRYISTYGAARRDRQNFVAVVMEECLNHEVGVCFIDSVGLAVSGNPGDFEVVVEFFEEVVADFTAHGITPVLIDHQRRLIPGERNQSLGAYGSVWKENLSRTQLQIELVGRDREAHTVTTRLRPKKTNFGELPEPLEVRTTFSEEAIKLEVVETDDADRASEETVAARDRVLAALRTVEEAGPDEITEICQTLKRSTVRNVLTRLRNEVPPLIENTGNMEGRSHKVRLVTVTGTYKGDGDGDGSPEFLTVERALKALRHGNGPRKAYEHFCCGAQNLESVTKSVLHYCGKDPARWREARESVVRALEVLEAEEGAASS